MLNLVYLCSFLLNSSQQLRIELDGCHMNTGTAGLERSGCDRRVGSEDRSQVYRHLLSCFS